MVHVDGINGRGMMTRTGLQNVTSRVMYVAFLVSVRDIRLTTGLIDKWTGNVGTVIVRFGSIVSSAVAQERSRGIK